MKHHKGSRTPRGHKATGDHFELQVQRYHESLGWFVLPGGSTISGADLLLVSGSRLGARVIECKRGKHFSSRDRDEKEAVAQMAALCRANRLEHEVWGAPHRKNAPGSIRVDVFEVKPSATYGLPVVFNRREVVIPSWLPPQAGKVSGLVPLAARSRAESGAAVPSAGRPEVPGAAPPAKLVGAGDFPPAMPYGPTDPNGGD